MASSDRLVGFGLLVFVISVFVYYTTWVLITPFVDRDHFLQQYFPPREYAISIPLALLAIGLSFIFTFVSLVMIKSKK